jgi:hypothetical protein
VTLEFGLDRTAQLVVAHPHQGMTTMSVDLIPMGSYRSTHWFRGKGIPTKGVDLVPMG